MARTPAGAQQPTLVHRPVRQLGIALLEYLLQVPANRIGYTVLSLGQRKVLQEAITLTVFVPFAVLYIKQSFKLDFL